VVSWRKDADVSGVGLAEVVAGVHPPFGEEMAAHVERP